MLDFTMKAASINSGSFNPEGVNEVAKLCSSQLSEYKSTTIKVPPLDIFNDQGQVNSMPLGDALHITKPSSAKLRVLLVGHLDTVFAKDSNFQKVKLDGKTLYGPGVADMKGGIAVMFQALKEFEKTKYAKDLAWDILLTPDEEIGSAGSSPILKKLAKKANVGLVFEPSTTIDGVFAGQRKGSGDFTIIVHGKASHAGRDFESGKNAIVLASSIVKDIHALNGQRDDVTINIGKVAGGQAINVVADVCVIKLGMRYPTIEDEAWLDSSLNKIVDSHKKAGFKLQIHGKFGRRPKLIQGDTEKLYNLVKEVGKELNQTIEWQATGGCCDGNNLSEYGLPNIDTLGVRGAYIHSDKEYMLVDSFEERMQLTLGLLIKLSTSW